MRNDKNEENSQKEKENHSQDYRKDNIKEGG
jgi:hypothetical protein